MMHLENVLAELIRRVLREELAGAKPSTCEALLSVAQAARRKGMSQSYIRAAILDGRLACERYGRSIRIRPADLDNLTKPTRTADDEWTDRAARTLGLVKGGRP